MINLNWTDNDVSPNTATGYNVLESTDGTNFTQVGTASAGATSFAVGSLTVSTKYYFEVDAFNAIGTSAFSNIANTTTTSQAGVLDFSSGFANSAGSLTYNGTAHINGTSAELTNGSPGETASFFSTNAFDVTRFSNQFTFQLTSANADGFTFTIQGDGPTALGPSGGGLGYGPDTPGGTPGIAKSVAIKFDLYDNAGEGSDSTGEYTNGASPTTPAIDLSATGINLHSGDVFQVVMSYDGTTLTVTITDTVTKAAATQTYAVNIPQVIGSNTGYLGFTGGTGGSAATQNILTWTYSPTSSTLPAAPSNLTGNVISGSEIDISWTNNANNATNVLIDRSTDGVNYTQIASVSATMTTYHDTSLSPGITYYYEVQASNAAGNSAFSNVYQAATLTSPRAPDEPDRHQYHEHGSRSFVDQCRHQRDGHQDPQAVGTEQFADRRDRAGSHDHQLSDHGAHAGLALSVRGGFAELERPFGRGDGHRRYVARPGLGRERQRRRRPDRPELDSRPRRRQLQRLSRDEPGRRRDDPRVDRHHWHVVCRWVGRARYDLLLRGDRRRSERAPARQTQPRKARPPSEVSTAALPGTTAFNAPSNLVGLPQNGPQVQLTWNTNSTTGTGFTVQRATNATFTQNLTTFSVAATTASTATYTDTTVVPATTYYYRVQALNGSVTTAFSNPVTAVIPPLPATPTNGHATLITTTAVDLAWTNNATNADVYKVFREIVGGAFTQIASLPGNATSFDDSNLTPGTNYDYHIEAWNISGAADRTGADLFTVSPAITTLAPTAGFGQVALAWTAPSGATNMTYNVYRGTSAGGEAATPVATGLTATSFIDANVTAGTTYWYEVTSVDPASLSTPSAAPFGESARSNEVSATPPKLVLAISAGGPAAGSFVADTDFSGGAVVAGTTAAINTSEIPNPPPQSVMQHGRNGNFTYTIPKLIAGASYLVRLDFVEFTLNAARQRLFNVSINGTQVLTNFDIWATAGGKNIATAKSFTVAASSSGTIAITFTTVVDKSLINGIEIYSGAPATPPAPTGLTPNAGNGQVTLNWTAVSGATGYDVYRGTTSGGETLLAAGTNVPTNTFTDTTAVNGTQYFYYVTALNGNLQSGKSNEISATPQVPQLGSLVLAISAGGPAAGSFVADTDFSGGTVSGGTKAAINESGITNPPPQSVLQHGRYGNVTYTIPKLTAGASYVVRLDFVEYAFNAAGSRVFNVAINGTQVLSKFDIWTAAGGENIAIVKMFNATASSTGTIKIAFTSVVNNSIINGIEIYTPVAQAVVVTRPTAVAAPATAAGNSGESHQTVSALAISGPAAPSTQSPAFGSDNSSALDAVFAGLTGSQSSRPIARSTASERNRFHSELLPRASAAYVAANATVPTLDDPMETEPTWLLDRY